MASFTTQADVCLGKSNLHNGSFVADRIVDPKLQRASFAVAVAIAALIFGIAASAARSPSAKQLRL